ncbi:unnamed protein product [Thelazia callipaeda]|uniref:BSD domain-containing protein n=1 Tax=Thelazia callipaeda TaxID=103827 RepID=A0A0N5CMX9_THECL|nr:unnamed protein product [Thelazia callipaeda]
MENITLVMQQAKMATRKFSEMIYVPAEDIDDAKESLESKHLQKEVVNDKSDQDKDETDLNNVEIINASAAVEAAKKYASSLFSLAKEATVKAAITAEETAKKLQTVVAEKTPIGIWEKEQAKFNEEMIINESNTTAELPWSDIPDQWIVKKHILALSLDSRNFTRDPPSETNFDLTQVQSVAIRLLEEDPNLRKIRFQLVPKKLSEERFWRNYFYRISLVRQSALKEKLAEIPVCSENFKGVGNVKPSDLVLTNVSGEGNKEAIGFSGTNNEERKEVIGVTETRNGKLNVETQKKVDEDWEQELVNDFNDYEVINSRVDKTDQQWEDEIIQLLDSS